MDLADSKAIMNNFKYENIKTVHFEFTNKCQAACPQCERYADIDILHSNLYLTELLLEDIKNNIETSFIQKLHKIYACGVFGDPAVAKDCYKIFNYFRKINPDITLGMNTNGGIRNATFWTQMGNLFSKEKDYVVFSIDGLEDTNHIYRRNTSFKKIIANALSFIKAGGNAHWDMLVFDYNEHQIEECKSLAKNLGFKFFRYKVSRRFNYKPVVWLNPPKSLDEPINIKTSEIDCIALKEESIYIDAHGHLLPCCFFGSKAITDLTQLNRYNISLYDINIKTNSMKEILKHAVFLNLPTDLDSNPLPICSSTCSIYENETSYSNQWRGEFEL